MASAAPHNDTDDLRSKQQKTAENKLGVPIESAGASEPAATPQLAPAEGMGSPIETKKDQDAEASTSSDDVEHTRDTSPGSVHEPVDEAQQAADRTSPSSERAKNISAALGDTAAPKANRRSLTTPIRSPPDTAAQPRGVCFSFGAPHNSDQPIHENIAQPQNVQNAQLAGLQPATATAVAALTGLQDSSSSGTVSTNMGAVSSASAWLPPKHDKALLSTTRIRFASTLPSLSRLMLKRQRQEMVEAANAAMYSTTARNDEHGGSCKKVRRPRSPQDNNSSPSPTDGTYNDYQASYTEYQSDRARRCASCQVTKTPVWRDHGNIPLCNACGIRFKKFWSICSHCRYVPRGVELGPTCVHCGSDMEVSRQEEADHHHVMA